MSIHVTLDDLHSQYTRWDSENSYTVPRFPYKGSVLWSRDEFPPRWRNNFLTRGYFAPLWHRLHQLGKEDPVVQYFLAFLGHLSPHHGHPVRHGPVSQVYLVCHALHYRGRSTSLKKEVWYRYRSKRAESVPFLLTRWKTLSFFKVESWLEFFEKRCWFGK